MKNRHGVVLLVTSFLAWSAVQTRADEGTKDPVAARLRQLRDADVNVRRSAAIALRREKTLARDVLPVLIEAYKQEADPGVSEDLSSALGSFGRDAGEVLPVMLQRYEKMDIWHSAGAALAIARIHGEPVKSVTRRMLPLKQIKTGTPLITFEYLPEFAPQVVVQLVDLLANDKEAAIRASAADMLGFAAIPINQKPSLLEKIGDAARTVEPALFRALGDPDLRVRSAAAVAIGAVAPERIGPAIPVVVEALIQENLEESGVNESRFAGKMSATLAARLLKPVRASAVPALIAALDRPVDSAHQEVAWALNNFGPEILPELNQAAHHESARVRAGVAIALGQYHMRERKADCSTILFPLLRDADAGVRLQAATSLHYLEAPDLTPLTPVLAADLTHADQGIRLRAAALLGQLKSVALSAVPALQRALDDSDVEVRREAAMSLATVSPGDAAEATSALRETIRAWRQSQQQIAAQDAVKQPVTDQVAAQRAVAAHYAIQRAADRAVHLLGRIGPAAKSALPELASVLDSNDERPRLLTVARAAESTLQIDPSQVDFVVGKLQTVLTSVKRPGSRHLDPIIDVLGRIGPPARSTLPLLVTMLDGDRFNSQIAAMHAVAAIDPRNPDFAKLARDAFSEPNVAVCQDVVSVFRKNPRAALPFLPELIELLTANANRRPEVIEALVQLGPDAKSAIPALQRLAEAGDPTAKAALKSIMP